MFERFTERAREVVVIAQREAKELQHTEIGTEHLLLGLLAVADGLGSKALIACGLTEEEVRVQVIRIDGRGTEFRDGQLPLTQRAKRVLELALREALSMGHNYIATEHLALGLTRENEGVAARILQHFGVDNEAVRDEILVMLSGNRQRPKIEPRAALIALLEAVDTEVACPHVGCPICLRVLQARIALAREAVA